MKQLHSDNDSGPTESAMLEHKKVHNMSLESLKTMLLSSFFREVLLLTLENVWK